MFGRARQLMDAVEGRGKVTVQDVLNIFDDLCEDIVDEQKVDFFEGLELGDEEEVAKSTIRLLAHVRRLHRKNSTLFSTDHYRERWEETSAKARAAQEALDGIEQMSGDLAALETDTAGKLEKVQELEKHAEAIRQAHGQALALLKEKEGEEDRLAAEKTRMEGEIRRYETELLPKLQMELDRYTKALNQKKAERAALEEASRETQEEAVRERTELEKKKAGLDEEKESVLRSVESLKAMISILESDIASITANREETDRQIWEKKQEKDRLQEEYNGLLTTMEAQNSELAEWKRKKESADQLMSARQAEEESLKKSVEDTHAQLEKRMALFNEIWGAFAEDWSYLEQARPGSVTEKEKTEAVLEKLRRSFSEFEKCYRQMAASIEA